MVNSTLHVGGAERVAATLAKRIDRRRFEVTAAVLKSNGVVGEDMVRDGVDLVRLDRSGGKPDYWTSLRLLRLIRERRIEVVHTHDTHGLVDAVLCRLVYRRVRHVHTFHFGNYPHVSAAEKRLEKLFWRGADQLIAVGHNQAAAVSATYSIPAKRLDVAWNGVEGKDFVPDSAMKAAVEAAAGRPIIASISTLIPQKGLDVLMRAAAALRERGAQFHLIIAGDGHLKGSLERQVEALRLRDCVSFLGWVPEASRKLLPLCDVFVQSSLWEAMSVVVLEAMAAGKPMVITRVGENTRVVEHGRSALLVKPGDAQELADALDRVLKDAALRRTLAAEAQARYTSEFTVQPMMDRYERIYESLAAQVRPV